MDTPSRCFLSVLLLLCCQHAWSNLDSWRCVRSELAVVNYTCNFQDNWCAWRNNYYNGFNWTRVSDYANFHNRNYYLYARIYLKNAGDMTRLESRPICSSSNDEYYLEFDYRINTLNILEQNNICQLRVDLLGDYIAPTNLLRTQNRSIRFTHFTGNITFNDNFQIVFQAISLEKVYWSCSIYIDNVNLTHKTVTTPKASALPPTSMTTSTPHPNTSQMPEAPAAQPSQSALTPSLPPLSTAQITPSTFVRTSAPPETSVTSSDTAEQNLQTDSESQDVSPAGAVIGIVIGAVLLAVIVVVCTGVILVARRKASGREVHLPSIFKNLFKHHSTAEPRNGVFAVANSAFVSGDECIPVHEYPTKEPLENDTPNDGRANSSVFGDHYSVPHDSLQNDPGASPTSDYAVVDGSSDYYAMPVKKNAEFNPLLHAATGTISNTGDCTHKGMKQKRDYTTEYVLAAVIGSDDGYSAPDDVDLKAGRREQESTGRTDVDGSKGSDYIKLSFQTPSSADVKNTEDTYNHLQDQDNVYNVPSGGDSEYALARNPAQLPASAAQNQHYINVDERRKPVPAVEADTDYNHLNIKTGHSSVTERRSPPSDVYNHLDEAVHAQPSQQADDEYNRADFNGRPRVTGEADDDTTYNHLDTLQG